MSIPKFDKLKAEKDVLKENLINATITGTESVIRQNIFKRIITLHEVTTQIALSTPISATKDRFIYVGASLSGQFVIDIPEHFLPFLKLNVILEAPDGYEPIGHPTVPDETPDAVHKWVEWSSGGALVFRGYSENSPFPWRKNSRYWDFIASQNRKFRATFHLSDTVKRTNTWFDTGIVSSYNFISGPPGTGESTRSQFEIVSVNIDPDDVFPDDPIFLGLRRLLSTSGTHVDPSIVNVTATTITMIGTEYVWDVAFSGNFFPEGGGGPIPFEKKALKNLIALIPDPNNPESVGFGDLVKKKWITIHHGVTRTFNISQVTFTDHQSIGSLFPSMTQTLITAENNLMGPDQNLVPEPQWQTSINTQTRVNATGVTRLSDITSQFYGRTVNTLFSDIAGFNTSKWPSSATVHYNKGGEVHILPPYVVALSNFDETDGTPVSASSIIGGIPIPTLTAHNGIPVYDVQFFRREDGKFLIDYIWTGYMKAQASTRETRSEGEFQFVFTSPGGTKTKVRTIARTFDYQVWTIPIQETSVTIKLDVLNPFYSDTRKILHRKT